MRVLLDTNIVIHREAATAVHEDIGVLFKWLDQLHCDKCVHPVTVHELATHLDPRVRESLRIKLGNYHILQTQAPISSEVEAVSKTVDENTNDQNDTRILNELYNNRVDVLITEDRKILKKAQLLGIQDKVFTIDAYLEKVNLENPGLADYRVLSVKKELFGNLDAQDGFFQSLREDYPDFDSWMNRKADESVYICRSGDERLAALLYLKLEERDEDYSDISPPLAPKRRLKVGTFKVTLNGFRLGERFLKIVFDNALRLGVDEIYVTSFDRTIEQQRLIGLLQEFGFSFHGHKQEELVYTRDFRRHADRTNPNLTYPYFSADARIFVVPIYPEYHTELFPDSILRTESPDKFVENDPHRNAIRKVYISRSVERNLTSGDIIIFYRTGGFYRGVVTTVGVVENIVAGIQHEHDFVQLCRKRSVFTDAELKAQWDYRVWSRPFIVNFLYVYSFPKRINLKRLMEMGVIQDIKSVPRGFERISKTNLLDILKESQSDERIVIN